MQKKLKICIYLFIQRARIIASTALKICLVSHGSMYKMTALDQNELKSQSGVGNQPTGSYRWVRLQDKGQETADSKIAITAVAAKSSK